MTKSSSFSMGANERNVRKAGFLEIENIVKTYTNPSGV